MKKLFKFLFKTTVLASAATALLMYFRKFTTLQKDLGDDDDGADAEAKTCSECQTSEETGSTAEPSGHYVSLTFDVDKAKETAKELLSSAKETASDIKDRFTHEVEAGKETVSTAKAASDDFFDEDSSEKVSDYVTTLDSDDSEPAAPKAETSTSPLDSGISYTDLDEDE